MAETTGARMRYAFDVRAWATREDALDDLLSVLPIPEGCGRNLDALADALWELPPCDIELKGGLALSEDAPLGVWGSRLRAMLLDVSIERGSDLDLILSR